MSSARAICVGLLTGAVIAWSPVAGAEDTAAALALFQEGRVLMQDGSYALACAKFEESQRLAPAPGTLLNLGECQRKLGKTATAWATFNEAVTAAYRAGQTERESYARGRAAELESSLPRITIRVPPSSEVPGLLVQRDGVELGKVAWNTPLPVDPGEHVIQASAPNRRPWSTKVSAVERTHADVTVPALQPERDSREADREGERSRPLITQRRIGLVVGGLGLVAGGVGGFFGFQAMSTNDEANGHCRTSDFCDAAGLALKDDARGQAMLSTVFTIAGAAALVGGVVLYLTAKDDPGHPYRTAVMRW